MNIRGGNLKPNILIECNAFRHKYALNPYYGDPVRVSLDETGKMTIRNIDATGQPSELLAQIDLSEQWVLDGAEAALILTNGEVSHKISFYPRSSVLQSLFLSPLVRAAFSPRFKAVIPIYDEFRRLILRFGVKVQRHRVLGPIIIGVLLAVCSLAAIIFFVSTMPA